MKKGNDELGNAKLTRREMILRIITTEEIGTQYELTERLKQEGFSATQATVSRDIRELHLIKTASADGYRYQVQKAQEKYQASHKFYSLFKNSVVHVEHAMNQVVIHSYTGMAQAVCATMDGLEWPGVLGTIAGDDTILVVTRDEGCAVELTNKLREML